MENRHLFRGKRLDNGAWVVGWIYSISKGAWLNPIQNGTYITPHRELDNGEIILTGNFEIDPATLGQCTGLHAAKSYRGERDEDRLVFEGDRVCDGEYVYTVEWDHDRGGFVLVLGFPGGVSYSPLHNVVDMEIIGTIHDQEKRT